MLISGRGTNLKAIIDAIGNGQVRARIEAVISNRPAAPGLDIARAAGIPTHVVDHRRFAKRDAFDQALMRQIDAYSPALVVLAGFMRILGHTFIGHYRGRLINIHPSLLPAFPGLNTHARALAAGIKHHGASVHFVTSAVDAGPVIVQAAVPVQPDDTPDTLAARVLAEEHRIYPLAIRWFVEGRLRLENGRVLLDGVARPEQGLVETGEVADRVPDRL